MNKIKNFIKKLLEVPAEYTLLFVLGLLVIALSIAKNQFSTANLIAVVSLYSVFVMYLKLGSIVPKSVLSLFAILYATSIYTYLISGLYGYVIQPFFLTLAGTTAFLALTYSSYNHNLRSRPLWSAFLTVINVSVKGAVILVGQSYLTAEVVGANIVVLFILVWILWINKSKKTKLINPAGEEERKDEKYLYLYIDDELNIDKNTWKSNKENAYPYIYSKVMQAREQKLTLAIISTEKTSQLYDVEYIKVNKELVPYLYIEGKSDKYLNDIINQFEIEIAD